MSLYDGTTTSYESLDQQPSLEYFMQIFSYYLKTKGSNDCKIVSAKQSRSRPKLSQSIDSYLNYRKNIHNKLAEINANVSSMIRDSFKGIDAICFKVRQCMSDNEGITRPKPMLIETFCEYETEQKPHIIESIGSLTKEQTETNSSNSIGKDDSLNRKKLTDKLSAAKLSRKITKRSLLLEEFKETIENITNADFEMMEKIVENINEEIESFSNDTELECKIVIDNEQIKADQEIFQTLEQKDIQSEVEILNETQSNKSLIKINSTEDLPKTYIQVENFSEEKFDLLIMEKLPLCENAVIAEVYSRPGILDINKKLITQLEANDSFICFQRLMNKNKRQTKTFLKDYRKQETFNNRLFISSTYSHDTISKSYSNESCMSHLKKKTKKSKSKVNNVLSTANSISRKSVLNRSISGNSVSKMSTSKNYVFKKSISKTSVFNKSISKTSVFKKSISKTSVFKKSISKNSISKNSILKNSISKNSISKNSISKNSISKNSILKNSISKSQSLLRSDDNKINKIKYSNSLWFSEKYVLKVKNDAKKMNNNHGNVKRLKITNKSSHRQVKNRSLMTAPTPKNSLASFRSDTNNLMKCAKGYSCNVSITNDLPSQSNTKCRLRWMRAKSDQTHNRRLQFLDILDDLTPKDLLPLRSEYPRKDIRPTNKDVEDTYLYKLLYGNQDKQVWNHLLQPSIECSSTHCTKCRRQKCKKDETWKAGSISDLKIFSREKVLEKLAPHIKKQPYEKEYFKYITILPVRVFYDRHRKNEISPNKNCAKSSAAPIQKSPTLPMKETKGVDRASWSSPGSSKPMKVVHDSTVKRPEGTAKITPAHKLVVNSARHKEEKTVFKKKISKSFSPKGFSPYCSTANQINLPKKQSYIAANKTLDKYIKIQSDIEKKAKDIQEKSPSETEKKLWAHKYGKGVSQQLVTFIKNQPPHPTHPLPKYAVATRKTKDNSNEIMKIPRASLKNTARHKQVLAHLHGLKEKNDEIQNNLQKAINVIEVKMLDILSTPGDSSSIEAFDVMEKEITNVLSMMKFSSKGSSRKSTPNNGENAKKSDLESDFNLISDQLFKKLESILESEKSKGVTSTSDSDKKSGNKDKQETKYTGQKPHSPHRNSANKFCSTSATSTSVDENEQKIADPSKRSNQHRDRIGRKSKMSKSPPPVIPKRGISENNNTVVQKLSIEEYSIEKIEREYATGESFGIECTIRTDQKQKPVTQDYDETDNSRGDCIKQDISKSTDNVPSNLYCNYKINTLLSDTENKLDLKETIFTTGSKELIEEESNDTTEVSKDEICLNTVEEPKILIEGAEEAEEQIIIKEDPTREADKSPVQQQNYESLILSSDVETDTEESDPGLSGEVNKIIKRVEDIYSHLDDIQFSVIFYQLISLNQELFYDNV